MNDHDLAAIRELAQAFKSFRGFLTGVFSALSFASLYLLPGDLRISSLAFALFLTALGLVAALLTRDSFSLAGKRKLGIASLGLAAIAASAFIAGSVAWIFEVDGTAHVAGTGLTVEATRALDKRLVPNQQTALLNLFGHDSEDRIWTGRNVTKIALVASFAFSCALAATGCCLLTLEAGQRKRGRKLD